MSQGARAGVGDCRCAGLGGVQGGAGACRQCESGAWGLGSEGGAKIAGVDWGGVWVGWSQLAVFQSTEKQLNLELIVFEALKQTNN